MVSGTAPDGRLIARACAANGTGHNVTMPDIASVLKSEIARIARKEVRAELEGLKKSVRAYRTEIAELKRRCDALEKTLRQLHRSVPKPMPTQEEKSGKTLRFSPKGLASQRQRLGLSADAFGLLIGASGQSVYNWEGGATRPRADHLAAIAALRGLSKSQAAEVLASRTARK
jgi:DNA-binding transcriptional regulator YiaG